MKGAGIIAAKPTSGTNDGAPANNTPSGCNTYREGVLPFSREGYTMKGLWKSALLPSPRRGLLGLLLGLLIFPRPGAAEPSKLILALGDDSYFSAEAVRAWTNAEVKNELGERDLLEFAVVILSNIPYAAVPTAVQERLPESVSEGGSLLITGGPSSFGSGGYQAIAPLVPFQFLGTDDWHAFPFKMVLPLQPNHPIVQGVTFRPTGTFNDLNPKPGAKEIARYAGGRLYPSPLINEQQVGQGTVVGVALDLSREVNGWEDGNRFVQNLFVYLVNRSPLKPRTGEYLSQTFSRWQESCDRELRRALVGGYVWSTTATDCRRELAEDRFPYMDLADQWLMKRLEIARRVDEGELSTEAGNLELQKINLEIQTQIERR